MNPFAFVLVYMPAADMAFAVWAGSIIAGAIVAAVQIALEEIRA